MRVSRLLFLIMVPGLMVPVSLQAYATYAKWSSSQVTYYINPANLDVDPTVAEAAVKSGADAWAQQSSANFSFSYGGRVSDSATALDNRNVVIFRNASNGGPLANTYWWSSSKGMIDADIVFWDGAYQFFAGTTGCSGGAYIEDVATHEFGHALGLDHSAAADATMYAYMNFCGQAMRSLAADDIAGVQALFKVWAAPAIRRRRSQSLLRRTTAPFSEGGSVTFNGTATDTQDGNLSSQLRWSSNVVGEIGVGERVAATLPAGSHVITATATDSGRLTTSRQIALSVVAASVPAPTGLSLTARAYKVKGLQRVDLTWRGTTASSIDVYRNGTLVKTGPNDGGETDAINTKGAGTYSYRVCEAGTGVCSATVVASF